MKVPIVRDVLDANERIALQNRAFFSDKRMTVINMMSAPGAGKTTLLANTIRSLKNDLNIAVIEGDIQSSHDAEQISATGAQVVQINTGGACHLDAGMISESLNRLDLETVDLLVIENVGNLVCPAEFNLGEDFKVMMLSVAEGDDKPMKYPLMFHQSRALIINKLDLLPYVDCSLEKIRADATKINPHLSILALSAKTGKGVRDWHEWLRTKVMARRSNLCHQKE